MNRDSTFIGARSRASGGGLRVVVKDCIDVAGKVTTVGSPAYARTAPPAAADAACLRPVREAGLPIIGKTNLHELCFGSTGVNPWYGTPQNPLDGSLIPGGSSSGSAVAVATGEADIGIGTDTAGSVRTPAACCGVVGYRPTFGRVPTTGVVALADSLDTVGLLGRTVADVAAFATMFANVTPVRLVEPRAIRLRGFRCDPDIDRVIDRALDAAGLPVADAYWSDPDVVVRATTTVLFAEAWANHGRLLRIDPGLLGDEVLGRLNRAASVGAAELRGGLAMLPEIRKRVVAMLEEADVLALPAYPTIPPRLAARDPAPVTLGMLAAAAGLPAIALPVPGPGRIPASLQLIGRPHADAAVFAVAESIEAEVGSGWTQQ